MKILVIGLDCADPALLFGEDLPTIRHLMSNGLFGPLESVIPPITVPAWMSFATSQDPGSLGVYGFRNRVDHSYTGMATADARWFRATTLWDQVATEGGRSILIGVPPSFPPRRMNGIRVGCFLTPDPRTDVFTHPASVGHRISELVGEYPVDVRNFRTEDKDWLHVQILDMTRKHFEVVRHFLTTEEWDYFQFVEIGLDRMHHGFWKHHDPLHPLHLPDGPYRDVIRQYYHLLDHEIATVLELLDEDTLVLVVSDHGARALQGGFCVNEWLMRQGLLTLLEPPDRVRSLEELQVDWKRTRVWGSGGYYSRIFLNVEGREPDGIVSSGEYEAVRDEVAARLEATPAPNGKPLGTKVFKPETIYSRVEGIAPDLIVYFGDLAWRAVGSVGHGRIHVQENDTGPDDCNHAQHGVFILAGQGVPDSGWTEGAHLLDLAPTLLARAGFETPPSMQGRDILANDEGSLHPGADLRGSLSPLPEAGEALLRERLRSLGYLS